MTEQCEHCIHRIPLTDAKYDRVEGEFRCEYNIVHMVDDTCLEFEERGRTKWTPLNRV